MLAAHTEPIHTRVMEGHCVSKQMVNAALRLPTRRGCLSQVGFTPLLINCLSLNVYKSLPIIYVGTQHFRTVTYNLGRVNVGFVLENIIIVLV